MNLHTLLDDLSICRTAIAVGKDKYFARSLDTPSIAAMAHALDLRLPPWRGEGRYDLPLHTLAGPTDPAFLVARWLGDAHPAVIYHHGNRESPFTVSGRTTSTFKRIFLDAAPPIQANLIVLRAPFHTLPSRAYMRTLGDLRQFVALLASSVRLMEALVQHCRALGSPRVVAGGLSLGGFVANIHRALYRSADAYVPLLAGAAFDHVFLHSSYRHLTARLARGNPQALHEALNFENAFAQIQTPNLHPLLALHDRVAFCDRQRPSYAGAPLIVLPKGHITAALDAPALRRHFFQALTPSASGAVP